MTGADSADEVLGSRPVLGDITNRPRKRVSSLILEKPPKRSGFDCEGKEGDLKFTQKVCQGVENIIKEKCESRCVVDENTKPKKACPSPQNVIAGVSTTPCEMEKSNSLGVALHPEKNDSVIGNVVEDADASRQSCDSNILVPAVSESCNAAEGNGNNDDGITSEVAQSDLQFEESVALGGRNSGKDIATDSIPLGKHQPVEWPRLSDSQGSKSFRLEKCVGLKGAGSSNSSPGVDLIKACSCSFCTKAAYIWTDLHYQDIKGRIAAIKKSQKEANIIAQRCSKDKGINKLNQGSFHKGSKLESDLMTQWRSMFLRMEDIFIREGNQLESNLIAIKDLRENCKNELEMANSKPPEKK